MDLHNLKNTEKRKSRKRVGRGDSSGLGRTAGRGEKGQMSRSGASHRPYFEGGQIPFFRRLPRRGFKSRNKKIFHLINVRTLDELFNENDEITINLLQSKSIIGKDDLPLKVLADGEITKPLKVIADKFSAAAKSKIETAGGSCELRS